MKLFWRKKKKTENNAVENENLLKSIDAEAVVTNDKLMKEFASIKTPFSKEELDEIIIRQNEYLDYLRDRHPNLNAFYCDEEWRTSAHIDVPDEELDPIKVWGKNSHICVMLSGVLELKARSIQENCILYGGSRRSAEKVRRTIHSNICAIIASKEMSLPEQIIALNEYDKELGEKWRYKDHVKIMQERIKERMQKK